MRAGESHVLQVTAIGPLASLETSASIRLKRFTVGCAVSSQVTPTTARIASVMCFCAASSLLSFAEA